MTLTISLTKDNKVSFIATESEEKTTGDVINLLMFVADKIIEESNNLNTQNNEQTKL